MFGVSKPLGLAIIFILISGVGQLAAPLLGGFNDEALQLVPFGVLFILIAWGLMKNWRWLAWLSFYIMIIGAVIALAYAMSLTNLPTWLYWLFAACNGLAAMMLFGYLWNPKPATTA